MYDETLRLVPRSAASAQRYNGAHCAAAARLSASCLSVSANLLPVFETKNMLVVHEYMVPASDQNQ